MAIKLALNQFNGGEISPQLEGRYDWQKYNYCSKLCKNFIPTVEGNLKRRGGSHFVAKVKERETFSLIVNILLPNDSTETPKLYINGTEVSVKDTTPSSQYSQPLNIIFSSDTLAFKSGDNVEIKIVCDGFRDTTDSIYIDNNITKNYELASKVLEDVTLTVTRANNDISFTLNGTSTNPYTTKSGERIVWTASYQGNSNTGGVYIYENKTMTLYLRDGLPYLGDANMLNISTPSEGTIALAAGKYRVTMVGGGGGYYFLGNGVTPKWYNGGSGGFVDVELNLSAGEYSWRCGAKEHQTDNSILPSGGTSSFLKIGSTVIVQANNGQNAGGGGTTVNNSYVSQRYTVQNGNGGGAEGNFTGKSRYGDYGRGQQIHNYSLSGDIYTINYTDGSNGYLALQYVGELEG